MPEPRGYLLEGAGRMRFFRGLTGTSLQKAIDAGVRRLKKHPRVKTFAITDSISAETTYYDSLGNRAGYPTYESKNPASAIPRSWTPARVRRLKSGQVQVAVTGRGRR